MKLIHLLMNVEIETKISSGGKCSKKLIYLTKEKGIYFLKSNLFDYFMH